MDCQTSQTSEASATSFFRSRSENINTEPKVTNSADTWSQSIHREVLSGGSNVTPMTDHFCVTKNNWSRQERDISNDWDNEKTCIVRSSVVILSTQNSRRTQLKHDKVFAPGDCRKEGSTVTHVGNDDGLWQDGKTDSQTWVTRQSLSKKRVEKGPRKCSFFPALNLCRVLLAIDFLPKIVHHPSRRLSRLVLVWIITIYFNRDTANMHRESMQQLSNEPSRQDRSNTVSACRDPFERIASSSRWTVVRRYRRGGGWRTRQ